MGTRLMRRFTSAFSTRQQTSLGRSHAALGLALVLVWPTAASAQAFAVEAHLSTMTGRAGSSVAITADGSRAIVGERLPGGIAIYVRAGTTWTLEAEIALPGEAVAVSADGSVAAGVSTGALPGPALTVLRRSGTTWTASSPSVLHYYQTVALSGDGTRLVACAGSRNECYVFVVGATSVTPEATLGRFRRGSLDVATPFDGSRVAWADDFGIQVFARSGTTWTFEYFATTVASTSSHSVSMTSDGARIAQWDWGARQTTTFVRMGTTWRPDAVATISEQGSADGTAISGNGARLVTRGWATLGNPVTWMFRFDAGSYVRAGETTSVWSPIRMTATGDRLIGLDPGGGGAVVLRIPLVAGERCGSGAECESGVCVAGCCDVACVEPDAGAIDAGVMDAGASDAAAMDAGVIEGGVTDSGVMLDAGAGDSGARFDAGTIDAPTDSAVLVDAGVDARAGPDGAAPDAAPASLDAGTRDADTIDGPSTGLDAGTDPPVPSPATCGCAAHRASEGNAAVLALLAAVWWRRRR